MGTPLRSLLASIAAALLMPAAASATTITVPPGASLSAAYNTAQAGDVIELQAGQYGAWDTPSGSKPVTVRAAAGAKPTFTRLHAFASNLTFDGLDIDAQGRTPMCGGSSCAAFETRGVPNVTFRNGRIGNVVGQKAAFLGGESTTEKRNVVIDNVEFHDVRLGAAGQHLECVMSHTPGVTFRNSTFRNCETFDISLGRGDWWGQPEYGNVTIEGNVFGHSTNGSGWHYIGLAWWLTTLDGARVVNNTFENTVGMDRATRGTGGVWANNVGGGWDCVPGVTYTGNVGKKCGATDKPVSPSSSCAPSACAAPVTAPVGWASPAAFDFHLAFGSPAIDVGDATKAPATDRDGKARVGRTDAGAYEFGTPAPEPTPTPTPTATPTPTPAPTPSPTADPTPTPEPTPDPQDVIAQLEALVANLRGLVDTLTAERDQARAERDEAVRRVTELETDNDALRDRIRRAVDALTG